MLSQYYHMYTPISAAAWNNRAARDTQRYWMALLPCCEPGASYTTRLVKDELVADFEISSSTAYSIINRGNGLFWSYKRGKVDNTPGSVIFFTPEQVAENLGINDPGECYERPIDELLNAREWKAYVYRAELEDVYTQAVTTLTRKKITEILGPSPRTQCVYDKTAGIPSGKPFNVVTHLQKRYSSPGSLRQQRIYGESDQNIIGDAYYSLD